MGKPSSSARKKRPKYSSLDRRARKISKTKRAKAKKIRRYDDSDSYSTDDSASSPSVSLSSEDSYRGRKKSRRSIRKDAKGTKRRARSHSSTSSGEESLPLRKRKRSRRKVDPEVRKKTIKPKKKDKKKITKKKKRSRRDASISSRSSSTCESSSGSSDESEYESRRGRSKKRGNNLKGIKDVKSISKKRIYRSRSGSSCSRERESGGSDYGREENVTDGNMSKRLRSVITFIKDDREERELDEHKEEIIYEDDGYPSSRSNDSYDDGSKRSSGNQSPVASEKNKSTENEKTENPFDIKTTQLSCRYLGGDDQPVVEAKPASDGFGTSISLEEKTDEIAKSSGKENDDLEIILRQKALENLKRFRRTSARNTAIRKDESCGDSKSPRPIKVDLSQNDPEDHCAKGVEGDTVHYLQEEKIIDGKEGGNGSSTVENNDCPTNKIVVAERDKVNTTFRRGLNKQRLVTSALKQALSSCNSSAVESPKVKLVAESGSGELDVTCVGGKNNSDKVNDNASAKSSTGEDAGLNRLQDEDGEKSRVEQRSSAHDSDACGSNTAVQADGKEASQLERKTMSVMRGGEVVQVSYKVYIPKKTPALARRQLKR